MVDFRSAAILATFVLAACSGTVPHRDSGGGGMTTVSGNDASILAGHSGSGGATTPVRLDAGNKSIDVSPPPVVLGNCDHLPDPGKWENVSPQEALAPWIKPIGPATSGALSPVTHPTRQGTVFVNGINRGLFKSEDCGSSWKHLNTGANGDQLDGAVGVSIVINPISPDIIYAWTNYGSGGVWKSTDGGVNWTQKFTGVAEGVFQYGFVNYLSMDPKDPDHLVAAPHSPCMGAFAPDCMMETRDGGSNWRIFKSPPWIESIGVIIFSDKIWLYATGLQGLYRTTDAGETWATVAGVGGTYPYGYISDAGHYFIPSSQGVLTTTSNDASSWSSIEPFGMCVHLAGSETNMFACNQWSGACAKGPEKDPSGWTSFQAPPELPPNYGASGLAYDRGHHVLYYTSTDSTVPNFQGGIWRLVIN